MSSKMNANVAQLMAFLIWNALQELSHDAEDISVFLRARVNILTNDLGGLATSIFEVVIVIFIIGALIGNIANVTTGITIAHSGFTPNANLTASPGAVPLTQLYPLVFVAIGLMAAFAYFKHVET